MLFNLLHGGKQMNVLIITEHPGNDTIILDAFWITEDGEDVWETGIWIILITADDFEVQEVQCGVIPPGGRGCNTQH